MFNVAFQLPGATQCRHKTIGKVIVACVLICILDKIREEKVFKNNAISTDSIQTLQAYITA
jgi:hypothetical protein